MRALAYSRKTLKILRVYIGFSYTLTTRMRLFAILYVVHLRGIDFVTPVGGRALST